MSFQISDLTNTLNTNNGVQRPTLFNVVVNIPNMLFTTYGVTDSQALSFLCTDAAVPNPDMDSRPVFRYGYGPIEYAPFNAIFNPQTYNFITDSGGFIVNFFRDWTRGIIEYSSEGNINNPAMLSPNMGMVNGLPYLLNYKNNYSTQITFAAYDQTGQTVDLVTLLEAFPLNVSDISFSWGNSDQYVITPITFAFKDPQYDKSTRRENLLRIPSYSSGAFLEAELIALEALADTITFLGA